MTEAYLHQDLAALLCCEALRIAMEDSSQSQRADSSTYSDAWGICMQSPPDIGAEMEDNNLSPLAALLEQGNIAGPGVIALPMHNLPGPNRLHMFLIPPRHRAEATS